MELKICHLYPEILSLNGDRGNILSLCRRLEQRGISVSVTALPCGEKADLSEFDLFFMGGGQDFNMDALVADLKGGRADDIRAAVENGKTFLAVCGGYIAMCREFIDHEGKTHELIGAIDAVTTEGTKRLTGNCMFEFADSKVVGFEHHTGQTALGSGCESLGKVLVGYGNDADSKEAGARYKNVFATYVNGPILPKNPEFCDCILRTALEHKYGSVELMPLEDKFENAAHSYMVERLSANEAGR